MDHKLRLLASQGPTTGRKSLDCDLSRSLPHSLHSSFASLRPPNPSRAGNRPSAPPHPPSGRLGPRRRASYDAGKCSASPAAAPCSNQRRPNVQNPGNEKKTF